MKKEALLPLGLINHLSDWNHVIFATQRTLCCEVLRQVSFPFSFQFFTRLATVFAEEVGEFGFVFVWVIWMSSKI